MNPLMFYRSVEFARGEDAGNAMLGLTAKYKLKENLILYSQLVIDDFALGKISDLGYWSNKFGLSKIKLVYLLCGVNATFLFIAIFPL